MDLGDQWQTIQAALSEILRANWRAIRVAMLLLDCAMRPSRRAESLEGLRVLVSGD